MINWVNLIVRLILFLKVIKINLDLKFKLYLIFLTQNIINAFKK